MKSYCERTKAVNIRFPRAGWSELAARVKSATEDKTTKKHTILIKQSSPFL